MSRNPLEDILNTWESLPDCAGCGMIYDPGVDGKECFCCKKAHNGRVLRETTLDTARFDYSALDELSRLLEDENLPVLKPKPRKSGKSGQKGTRAPTTVAAETVMNEFEDALIADGFLVGANRDGTAVKYRRYMSMLFDHGIFTTRADFFKAGARTRAHEFYKSQGEKKATENGGKTNAKKLYRNFANGFDKFILLCANANIDSEIPFVEKPVEEDSVDTEWIDDLLDELGVELGE
tara:strand:+ start:38 stop:745 length:708 start_codon:yes stop_codon:yes gene_type:complete